ncbi:hypothetical protein HDA40_006762 [Hamadaea flava]|uniref:DUF308 domain-containing protein n=1 Tax=Hamadaea flava TaxID=1742688 RepID=A0ABV8LUB3_9ACTN|nr:hypothetical protein [Hamadaea flava]MCP2328255.1 hypothetical protein [Hamadaea flava]
MVETRTVVATPMADRLVGAVGLPLAGAGVGWLARLAAGWIAGLPWAPFQGVFKTIDSFSEPAATLVTIAIGFAAGVVFAFTAVGEWLTVTVTPASASLARVGEPVTEIARGDVASVFADGKDLVLLGSQGQELAREKSDIKTEQLKAAFAGHGFPWLDGGDPHHEAYKLWVPGVPGLPEGADAVLAARAEAVRKSEDGDKATYRKELLRLGVIVRDEKKHQYWRLPG